jgi:purine-binding chemotaxis protein CheW
MDILKIRKAAKKARAAAPTSPPAPEAAPEPRPVPKPALPAEPTPAAEPPRSTPPVRAAPAPEAPEPRPEPPSVVDDIDPLQEFLARYDLGDTDDGVTEHGGFVLNHEFDRPRYLAFSLEGEEYAVSIMDVREILRVVTLTEVPRAPSQILGVLSKRGVVMPIIDLGAALGLRPAQHELNVRQRVLVVGDGAGIAGLRVDELHEVVEFESSDIEDVPASLGARSVHLLRGLGRSGDRMFILLEVAEVLAALASTAGIEEEAQ